MKGKVFIPLTKGQVVVIDLEDYNLVRQYKWYANKGGVTYYAKHSIRKFNTKLSMHRLVTHCPETMMVDHIDGNGLNNCRNNLRICYNK